MEKSNLENSKVLIISSMHRSGSSLTASLLQSAGLHIGRRLMEPNEGNIKGYFENNDFYDFHKKVLKSQGIHEDGWTLQESIHVETHFIEEAKEIICRNSISAIWGWKEPRTTLFLDFWLDLLPDAKFLLVYRAPWEVVDSMYRRSYYDIFQNQPDLAVKIWLHYNQKILNFCNKFSQRCLLANLETIVKNPTVYNQTINQKFQINLGVPASDIYDASLLQRQPVDSHRASLINHYFPEAIALYRELEARAWQPDETVDFSWLEQLKSSPYRVWAFQDWVKVGNLQGENHKLQEELGQTQSHLHQTQEELGQTQSQLHQTQEVLEQSQAQLHETEAVLEQSMNQLQQKNQELQHSQSQVSKLHEELARSQSQQQQLEQQEQLVKSELVQTRSKLEEVQPQLYQMEAMLAQYQSHLQQIETLLEQSQTQLHQSQEECQQWQTKHEQNWEELKQTQERWERSQAKLHDTESALERSLCELQETRSELERYKAEVERSRLKETLASAAENDRQTQYNLLLWDAWQAYRNGKLNQMAHCLQQSLKCTPLSRTETLLNWLETFSRFSAENGYPLDIQDLTNSAEWQQLVRRVTAVKSLLAMN